VRRAGYPSALLQPAQHTGNIPMEVCLVALWAVSMGPHLLTWIDADTRSHPVDFTVLYLSVSDVATLLKWSAFEKNERS
jgi:hypothetical protein